MREGREHFPTFSLTGIRIQQIEFESPLLMTILRIDLPKSQIPPSLLYNPAAAAAAAAAETATAVA